MRSGRELFPVNIVGMVICLGGILAHVVRKATQPIDMKSDSLNHQGQQFREGLVLSRKIKS